MAIAITKTLPSGVVGTYAKITGLTWELSGAIYLTVSLFLDKASADAGKDAVFTKSFTLNGDLTQATALFTVFYNKLLLLPDFNGGSIAP